MIRTKHDQTDNTPKQLGFEDAAVKGKLYNPLTGRELASVVAKRINDMLQSNEIDMAHAQSIQLSVERELLKHPSFESEVLSYPRADVSILLAVGPGPLKGNTSIPLAAYVINVSVAQYPQEEKRGVACTIKFINSQQIWEREPLQLETSWNLDDIPPDATRILSDIPVPTPQRTPGSGPGGVATVTDEAKLASEKQREAVVKQFGGATAQTPPATKGGQKK